MKNHRVIQMAIVGLFALLSGSSALAAPPTPDVNVVNTPDVNVVNTPDVNVANMPDVYVANVREPVALFVQIGSDGSGAIFPQDMRDSSTGDVEPFIVPDGKQLVIEYVSMETFSDTLGAGELYRGMILSPFSQRHLVGLVTSENDYGSFGAKSGQMVKIRIPEGQTVTFGLQANFAVLVNVDLSGYLENM